jgi:hypothetical protein
MQGVHLPVNVCLPTCEFVFEGWPVRERKRKRERERERESGRPCVCVYLTTAKFRSVPLCE